MMNFILRVILVMLGLVFAASLAVAVGLLAAVWGCLLYPSEAAAEQPRVTSCGCRITQKNQV